MRVGRAIRIVARISIGLLTACGAFASSKAEDSDAGARDGSFDDASPVEASTTDAAADAGVTNLLINGDFEFDCANWNNNASGLSGSSTAHSGARSCQVCASVNAAYGLYANTKSPPILGARYQAEVWVRATDTDASSSLVATLLVRENGAVLEQVSTTGFVPTPSWQRLGVILEVTKNRGDSLRLDVTSLSAGTCFLIDDALVFKQE
jgi:hypothetical protein